MIRFFSFRRESNFVAMHDFLKDVCPFTIKLCLNAFTTVLAKLGVNASFFIFDDRIKNFSYYEQTNKPTLLLTNESLKSKGNYSTKQKAGQNFCLSNMFPLLIGNKIPKDDIHFKLFFALRRIMDIIFCPVLTHEHTFAL